MLERLQLFIARYFLPAFYAKYAASQREVLDLSVKYLRIKKDFEDLESRFGDQKRDLETERRNCLYFIKRKHELDRTLADWRDFAEPLIRDKGNKILKELTNSAPIAKPFYELDSHSYRVIEHTLGYPYSINVNGVPVKVEDDGE